MNSFYPLNNSVRNYAWGDPSIIPDFLGVSGDGHTPVAELWIGAHPLAPSKIKTESEIDLNRWIADEGLEILGSQIKKNYGKLPFLLKLIAASESLSIQAHPDKAAAEKGFAKEEKKGIPIDAQNRNYKDDNHKPEIIMALAPFTAMAGFRSLESISNAFSKLAPMSGVPEIKSDVLARLASGEKDSLERFIENLFSLEDEQKVRLLRTAVFYASGSSDSLDSLQRYWIKRLADKFPADLGVLAPLYLNIIELSPGEAIYLPEKTLHAYLEGFGVELMANSDNVLRGGLTHKNIDVDELLANLRFEPFRPNVIHSHLGIFKDLSVYPAPVKEFTLGTAFLKDSSGKELSFPSKSGPLIVLVADGCVTLKDGDDSLRLMRGQSAFIPYSAKTVHVAGEGQIVVAMVGNDFLD